ncbi:DUF4430 domain-containing protein [Ornithinibacillus xuwenensis]|uniref:DUF4430 domain-containing protein n=1 Tax=Ornithinibacillus xuwenensis TaxID=3144668 RepID=A0ABU9XH92_9BACI
MRFAKLVTSLFLAILLVVTLSACGSSLAKPTGLEENSEAQQVSEDEQTTVEKEEIEETEGNTEADSVAEDKNDTTSEANEKDRDQDSSKPTNGAVDEGSADSTTSDKQAESGTVNKSGDGNSEKSAQPKKEQPSKSDSTKETEPKKETKPESEEEPKEEKTADTIVYSIVISDTEIPLPPTEMEVFEGDTVLDALIRITQEKKIQMDYRGGQGASAYVEGIANVYEFDRGQGSGWMYRVNGIFPDRSAGIVPLLPGDRVEWLYTTDLGRDLGANLQPFRR